MALQRYLVNAYGLECVVRAPMAPTTMERIFYNAAHPVKIIHIFSKTLIARMNRMGFERREL